MAFTIPNEADAFHADQSEIDKVDLDILAAAMKGNGVIAGLAVTAQGTPDMTVAVAAGTVIRDGVSQNISGANATIGAAHATDPRFDLVVISAQNAISVRAGTAAANPVFPALTAGDIALAAVYVPANDTAIDANQITDKRIFVKGFIHVTQGSDLTVNNSVTLVNTDLYFDLPANGKAEGVFVVAIDSGTTPDAKYQITSGTSPATSRTFMFGLEPGATSTVGSLKTVSPAFDVSRDFAGAGATVFANTLIFFSVTNGATPSRFTLQFAQQNANASNTIFKLGSFVSARIWA